MPVYDGVDAHKTRPVVGRGIEVRERSAVWIGASGADEDGAHGGEVGQVRGKSFFHGFVVLCEGEVVFGRGGGDEVGHGGERVG